jgi:hypothetical protein
LASQAKHLQDSFLMFVQNLLTFMEKFSEFTNFIVRVEQQSEQKVCDQVIKTLAASRNLVILQEKISGNI